MLRETRSSARVAGVGGGSSSGVCSQSSVVYCGNGGGTKECRVGNQWELLYADDLVLTAESRDGAEALFGPRWKINSFLSEISVCWICTEKITLKIERARSVILRASPAICRSVQQCRSKPQIKYTIGNCKCKMASFKPHHRWLYQRFVVCMLT